MVTESLGVSALESPAQEVKQAPRSIWDNGFEGEERFAAGSAMAGADGRSEGCGNSSWGGDMG